MSLLMKALEKASQERRDGNEPADGDNRAPSAPSADGTHTDAAPPAAPDLTLEPLFPKNPASPAETPAPPQARATPAAGKPPERGDPRRDSARAATVMRASRREERGPLVYMRDHPMRVFSALVGLFVVGYGTYLYLQIYHPALFLPSAPPVMTAATRPVTAAPGAPAPATAPVSGLTTLKPMAAATPAAAPAPLSTATPSATAATVADATPATPRAAAAADAVPQAPAAPRDRIRVTTGGAGNTVNPTLATAYGALQSGDLDAAQRAYALAQKSESANPDVWLGLAALASRRGDNETAARHYLKALELDPGNAAAQAGFIGLTGRADPGAAESRLKDLISRQPTAFLYTALGNLYADQNRWAEAQQAYFDAHHMQPDNPDYAYNLAVGLEHVGQPAVAVNFYKRALALAASAPARFDTAAAQARIDRIERGAR